MGDPAKDVAEQFVRALVAKSDGALAAVVDPNVDFRGLTPGRTWEATDLAGLAAVLWQWFEPSDHLEAIERFETGRVEDRHSLTYRLIGTNDGGPFVVEQQAYYMCENGRITWLRILCSGFRPLTS